MSSLDYQIQKDKERLADIQERIEAEQVRYEPAHEVHKTMAEIEGMGQKNYGGMKMKEITSTITKSLAVLGENGKGYTKEANFISWNGNDAKLDIREWHPNHERCGKGITLTGDEGRNLYAALKTIYEKE